MWCGKSQPLECARCGIEDHEPQAEQGCELPRSARDPLLVVETTRAAQRPDDDERAGQGKRAPRRPDRVSLGLRSVAGDPALTIGRPGTPGASVTKRQ